MMISILAAALIAAPVPAPTADAGTCYTVGDADARAYCLAIAHADPGRCYSIHSPDMRSRCLAEVRR